MYIIDIITGHDICASSVLVVSELCFDALTVVHYDVTGLTFIMYCDVIMDNSSSIKTQVHMYSMSELLTEET